MEKNPYEIATLFVRYLRDELSRDEQREVARLLKEDKTLRNLLEQYRDTPGLARRLAFMNRLDKDRAWQAVLKKSKGAQPNKMRIWIRCAAAAVLVAVSVLWWRWPTSQDRRVVADMTYGYLNDVLPGTAQAELILSDGKKLKLGETLMDVRERDGTQLVSEQGELQYAPSVVEGAKQPLMNTLKVPEAGTYRIRLPDGSMVWLNALSELKFPVRFVDDERRVYLKGEAFFEVAHNPAHPFKVVVNDSEVNVLGTTFNVDAYLPYTTKTTLVSGKVIISGGLGKEAVLLPQQQAVISGGSISVRSADVEKITAWKNGYFHFRQDNMKNIMEQLARWYGVKVQYKGHIPNENYGGSVDRQATLGEVLAMLKDVSGLSFEIEGMTVSVKGD